VAADKIIDSWHRTYGLPAMILRPFNTYGPRQSARAILPTIISQALAGSIVRLGSLHPRRDLTYVDDTVEGFVAAAQTPAAAGRTVQLGTGHDASIADLVAIVGELLGTELQIETDPARVRSETSEVLRLVSSPQLAREVLGWQPEVELRDGVARTIRWIERNTERYRADQYVI
jgi:dTDP-glucose 4,6-dehydratase